MRWRAVCLIVAVMILGSGIQVAAESQKEQAAVSAAQHWLGLVDDGKYAESWKEAAQYFRNFISDFIF